MKLLVFLIPLMVSPAYAQQSTIIGVGAIPCSEWTEARQAGGPKVLQLRAWLFGFVSGINAGLQPHGDMLIGENSETFAGWIDNYCQKIQARSLGSAANEMATEFVNRALAAGKLRP